MKNTLRVVRSRERERKGSDGEVRAREKEEEGEAKEGWMEKVTVSVSAERVWRDIPPLLVGGVVSTFPSLPPLPPDL